MTFRQKGILSTTIVAILLLCHPAYSFVSQKASSALRGDNFISSSNSTKKVNKNKARNEVRPNNEQNSKQRIEPQVKRVEEKNAPKKEDYQNDARAETADDTSAAAVDYNKHYASKLFSTLSGHITIEQDNIPKKIAVSKGSTIQINLKNAPETLWFFDTNEKVAKIKSNVASGNNKIVTIEAVGKGRSRMILDYISTKTSAYKVIYSKRMLIIVD